MLVVDGGGSVRRALVGGNLAAAAERNGWAGIVVHGCVRDAAELREAKVGIAALGLMPMPTENAAKASRTWCWTLPVRALHPATGSTPMKTASCSQAPPSIRHKTILSLQTSPMALPPGAFYALFVSAHLFMNEQTRIFHCIQSTFHQVKNMSHHRLKIHFRLKHLNSH